MGEAAEPTRQTAPQGPSTGRDVIVGFVVFVVGLLVAVGIPFVAMGL